MPFSAKRILLKAKIYHFKPKRTILSQILPVQAKIYHIKPKHIILTQNPLFQAKIYYFKQKSTTLRKKFKINFYGKFCTRTLHFTLLAVCSQYRKIKKNHADVFAVEMKTMINNKHSFYYNFEFLNFRIFFC